jgi:hypothetical protein
LNVNQELRELRMTTAIETFDALRPGDAYEARLAVRIILCGAHAVECLRRGNLYGDETIKELRYWAQAASLMREERAAKRILMQEQKMRLATEAVAKGGSAQTVAAAASPASAVIPAAPPAPATVPTPAMPQPAPVKAAPAQPAAAARPVPQKPATPHLTVVHAEPAPVQAGSAAPASPGAIEKAEVFMADNLEVALRIRHDRGVTQQCRAEFRGVKVPTDAAVIDALVRGNSPLLNLLNDFGGELLDAAD